MVIAKTDIKSTTGPFLVLPDYKIQYPNTITHALSMLYSEYNAAFGPLVEANKEFTTDYQYCVDSAGTPVNYFVQVDMVGLPDGFITRSTDMDVATVSEVLRRRIFEIENSLAMYSLIEGMFSYDDRDSFYKQNFRNSLDRLREMYGKPIALLAVTKQKYQHMKGSEFGKTEEESLTPDEVRHLSGFDRLFDPDDFKRYLEINKGNCEYLLYVRSSEPVAKLRNPDIEVLSPLLGNDEIRQVIKANAITFNVDNPRSDYKAKINDTKEYLTSIGMGVEINSESELSHHQTDDKFIRCKPMKGHYGSYGHVSGSLKNGDFRYKLKRGMRTRGSYIVQPEMDIPSIRNISDGKTYKFIDRNFFSFVGKVPQFLGGVRVLMPMESPEVLAGRVHGSKQAIYAEIN